MSRRWTQRTGGAAALAAIAAILLGCMNLSIAERTVHSSGCLQEGDLLCQEGKASLSAGERRQIFYPLPYSSPPNLELNAEDEVELEDQKPDHFVVHNKPLTVSKTRCLTWKARGVRRPTPEAVPPPTLPDRPVPVEKPNG
jgi:hypothetical protein